MTKTDRMAKALNAYVECACKYCMAPATHTELRAKCELFRAYVTIVNEPIASYILGECPKPDGTMMWVNTKFYDAAVAVAHAHEEVTTAMNVPNESFYDTWAGALTLLTQKKKDLVKALDALNELVAE